MKFDGATEVGPLMQNTAIWNLVSEALGFDDLPFRIIEVCFARMRLHIERLVVAQHTARKVNIFS
jgi:hypothetical protein